MNLRYYPAIKDNTRYCYPEVQYGKKSLMAYADVTERLDDPVLLAMAEYFGITVQDILDAKVE